MPFGRNLADLWGTQKPVKKYTPKVLPIVQKKLFGLPSLVQPLFANYSPGGFTLHSLINKDLVQLYKPSTIRQMVYKIVRVILINKEVSLH